MVPQWVIVAGGINRQGGMDRANYELAWYLADALKQRVQLVGFDVTEPLASHPLVQKEVVRTPGASIFVSLLKLRQRGRHVIQRARLENPQVRVVVNGGNCNGNDINWVHMVHHACAPCDNGAPLGFRLRNRLFRWLSKRDERRAIRASRLVIANSRKTQHELVEHLGVPEERIRVVYLGTDPEEFAPLTEVERQQARGQFGMSEKDVVLGFVGALGWDRNKGFDVLLAACRRLLDETNLPLRVLAAGGGALDFWRAEIARFGLQDRVQLIGHTSNIREVLAAFDLLVSPTRYDAYGLAVHEAICLGLPVIVSRAAGVAERFPAELAGFVLDDPNDAADLAQAIRSWHDRPEMSRKLFDRLAAELRSQSWERMAAEIVALAAEHPLAPEP